MFGLARWPLLVYLGAQLGDKIPVDLYQRHRSTEQWAWPPDGQETRFTWETIPGDDSDDAVLVLALSASVHVAEVPPTLSAHTVYRIAPANGVTPNYDVIGAPTALKSAENAFRAVLADIEHHRKHVRRLHVLGAAPLSACLSLGRALTRDVHPRFVLYDRVEGTYRHALEIH